MTIEPDRLVGEIVFKALEAVGRRRHECNSGSGQCDFRCRCKNSDVVCGSCFLCQFQQFLQLIGLITDVMHCVGVIPHNLEAGPGECRHLGESLDGFPGVGLTSRI